MEPKTEVSIIKDRRLWPLAAVALLLLGGAVAVELNDWYNKPQTPGEALFAQPGQLLPGGGGETLGGPRPQVAGQVPGPGNVPPGPTFQQFLEALQAKAKGDPVAQRFVQEFKKDPALNKALAELAKEPGGGSALGALKLFRSTPEFSRLVARFVGDPGFKTLVLAFVQDARVASVLRAMKAEAAKQARAAAANRNAAGAGRRGTPPGHGLPGGTPGTESSGTSEETAGGPPGPGGENGSGDYLTRLFLGGAPDTGDGTNAGKDSRSLYSYLSPEDRRAIDPFLGTGPTDDVWAACHQAGKEAACAAACAKCKADPNCSAPSSCSPSANPTTPTAPTGPGCAPQPGCAPSGTVVFINGCTDGKTYFDYNGKNCCSCATGCYVSDNTGDRVYHGTGIGCYTSGCTSASFQVHVCN